jgi:hypothetical protein
MAYTLHVGIYKYTLEDGVRRPDKELENLYRRRIVPMVVKNDTPCYLAMIFIRQAWKLTLQEMGELWDVEDRTVRRWEMGLEKVPMAVWTLMGIAGAYKDPVAHIKALMKPEREYAPSVSIKNEGLLL